MSIDRIATANIYIKGSGIEIGALHNKMAVPADAIVQYVDRMKEDELRLHYPELNSVPLVHVDIVDDGETLASVPDRSQDFVIANHFIEHCEDPIKAIKNMLRVLKDGKYLYLVVPDKRSTFDVNRPLTPLGHLLAHYMNSSEIKRNDHFMEYAKYVHMHYVDGSAEPDRFLLEKEAQSLINKNYSIHFHVWTADTFKHFLQFMQRDSRINLKFQIENSTFSNDEFLFVLKKQ